MKNPAPGKAVATKKQSGTTSGEDGIHPKPDAMPPSSQMWVVREIADTTWRMTVPVVIFAFIGILGDIRFGTKPWLTVLGTVIGFYFAIQLIKKQINRSKEISK